MIVLSTLIFTFLMSCGMIYFFLKIRNNQQNMDQQHLGQNGGGGILLPGMELSDSVGYYSTAGKQIDDEEYESIDMIDEHRYAPYHDIQNEQQQLSILPEEQVISDYYERMNTNVIHSMETTTTTANAMTNTTSSSSSPILMDSYYDDSNIRPSYLAMRRK